MKRFDDKYSKEALVYLDDCIQKERVIWMNMKHRNNYEKDYKKYILENFNSIFPNYKIIKQEARVDKVGYIDILAETEDKRKVVIELKIKNKNPNTQLLAYSMNFSNPILIGITEDKLSNQSRLKNTTYLTYSELGIKI